MPHIDINDLHRERDKRTSIRNEIYDKVLSRCHSKIKSISKLSDICCCFFEVPAYIYGLPSYNQIECIYYIIQVLMEDGFKVEFAEPNILFITWYDKPKKKTLADIATQSRMPIHQDQPVKRRTQSYGIGNSLYHDGLSELEVKSNQIFKEDIYNPRKQQHNTLNNLHRDNNTKSINVSGMNRTGVNKTNNYRKTNDYNNSGNMGGLVDFNPIGRGRMPQNTDFMEDNTKTFTIDTNLNTGKRNKPQVKKDGFRSLFNDSSGGSTYKKFKDDFQAINLDEIDAQFGLGPKRSSSPTPQMSNNIGFSEFNL